MKKSLVLFYLFLFTLINPAFSQLEITGSDEFGRIYDITYDADVPDKLYALTLGNHILMSEDNGDSWDILYTLTLGQAAAIKQLKLSSDGSSLTFSAYSPNTTSNSVMVYDIASQSIIKTIPLPNQFDYAFVNSYDFYTSNMDILLLGTEFPEGIGTEAKVYYTSDGGITWNMIYYSTNNNKISVANVLISPNDPQNIFITRGNGKNGIHGGLLVSTDAGQTFIEKLPNIPLDPISFDPSNNETILVGTGMTNGTVDENLYKSVDGGATFSIVPIAWTDNILNNINVIKFNKHNASQLILLEENEIAISNDGGNTFQNYIYSTEDTRGYYFGLNVTYNPQNSNEIFISADYVPLFSANGGETLSWSKNPYFTSTGNIDLFRNNNTANLYYGVQFGYVHRDLNTSVDTPYDIMPLNYVSNNPPQEHYADKLTPNRLYTFNSSFMGSSLMKSDDNGATKDPLISFFMSGLPNFTAMATFPNETEMILAAFSGDIGEILVKKIDFRDINNVLETNITLPNLDIVNSIIIDYNGKIILPIGTEVYSSLDGGTTWINSSAGLEIMTEGDIIFDLQQDPLNENRFALASSKGIFISEDGAESWVRKATDLVFNIAFSTETEGAMVSSTYSSEHSEFALHYSTDGGENWETINNEQLLSIGSSSSNYFFYDDSVKVYIGTYAIGLVEYTIDLSALGTPVLGPKENNLFIYPNPTEGEVNFVLRGSEVHHITLYTLTGAKILETSNSHTLNISRLETGVYLARVKNNKDEVFFKRVLKK